MPGASDILPSPSVPDEILEIEKQHLREFDPDVKSIIVNGDSKQNGIVYSNGDASEDRDLSESKGCGDAKEKTACCVIGEDDAVPAEGDETKDKDAGGASASSSEYGFTVRVAPQGAEAFEVQVSSLELVQEIHQLLVDREDTCTRTCFSLQLEGHTLDNFSELKNVEGLKDGSVIKVVEEPYTVREARIHVRHVRDLLKSLDPQDCLNGHECASLTFLNTITQGEMDGGNEIRRRHRPDSVDCTPPDYILPGSEDVPLVPIMPFGKDLKGPQCIKVLSYSGWNPPPGPRRMKGDLLYLFVVTLEDKKFHITSCSKGFYLNMSTDEVFDPRPASPNHLSHSLIDLLIALSPGFKRAFQALIKRRTAKHPFERVPTPYQVYIWTAPQLEHGVDSIRAEDAFSSKLGYEEHIPGQTRDWNEELQATRELSRKTLPDRLLRERAIFKVHSDFVTAATRGAVAVIDGNVMAINPGEEPKMHMFIWNNIFFSLGFDVRDHYKDLGGDAAAYVAPRNDLLGVRVYSSVDLEGLYTLGTVVIDYRGYRVTAQSIIPGILEREQEQSVVYGSIDFGKTIVTHEKYRELLARPATQLKILPHSVVNSKDEAVELCSSVECKGIIGNDGRHYILDLLRTFPPDVNFLEVTEFTSEDMVSDAAKALGLPIYHAHKLCCLRQELVDAFVDARYMSFIKHAALSIQESERRRKAAAASSEGVEKAEEQKEVKVTGEVEDEEVDDEAKKMVEDLQKKSKKGDSDAAATDATTASNAHEAIRSAAESVHSLKEADFDIRFNPDVFSPGLKHPEEERLKKERRVVADAAEFLLAVQIPGFIRECLDHSSAPLDGSALSEAMHNRGINIRYLGKLAELVAKFPSLEYLHGMCVSELLTRSAKHLFNPYMQGVDPMSLSAALSHYLNCFLSSYPSPHTTPGDDGLVARGSKKRKNRRGGGGGAVGGRGNHPSAEALEWTQMTPRTFWVQMKKELQSYYGFTLDNDSIDSAVSQFHLHKISLLRSFCLKVGVQILLREFQFDSKQRQTFTEEDIVNVFPVVKHVTPKASDAYQFYSAGQAKIQQGFLKDGYDLISEALSLLNNVYGAMHPEIAQCLRMIARLNYITGDYLEALSFQQRAVLMSERVNGIDHPQTITEYTHLALYCFANHQVSMALKLLYRARYLMLLAHGEHHPQVALLDSNIGLILHAVGEYELSLRFLEKSLALNAQFYGSRSIKVAVCHHLVARTQSCLGDFRSALRSEKETFSIYKSQLGEGHEKTRESSDCLRHLTQQAVVLQKKMNELYTTQAQQSIKGSGGNSPNGSASGNISSAAAVAASQVASSNGCASAAATAAILGNNKLLSSLATLSPLTIPPPTIGSVLDMLNMINGILFVQISQLDIENFRREMEKNSAGGGSSSGASTDAKPSPTRTPRTTVIHLPHDPESILEKAGELSKSVINSVDSNANDTTTIGSSLMITEITEQQKKECEAESSIDVGGIHVAPLD